MSFQTSELHKWKLEKEHKLDFLDTHKIGEGGYGPVYKGTLYYTPVVITVVRPDAAQGRAQFQIEVEVLTCCSPNAEQ